MSRIQVIGIFLYFSMCFTGLMGIQENDNSKIVLICAYLIATAVFLFADKQ